MIGPWLGRGNHTAAANLFLFPYRSRDRLKMARVHYVLTVLAALAVLFIAAEAGTMTGTHTRNQWVNNKAAILQMDSISICF